MRGSVPGLATAHPLAGFLPAYLQEDPFATRWVEGLDDVLAPILSVLDCLDAYVDPGVTAEDFLAWIGMWVGARLDERWDDARRRRAVAAAAALHGLRGTIQGLTRELEVATGGEAQMDDGGDVTIQTTPSEDFPPYPEPVLRVRLWVDRPGEIDPAVLDRIVTAGKPAHMVHVIEVVATGNDPQWPAWDGGDPA